MECYEGATMIKTFRGILADGGQDKINLKTSRGAIGYRIVKFQIFSKAPGASAYEHVVKIFKLKQTTVDGVVDFSDGDLLAASYLEGHAGEAYPDSQATIFEEEIFNQDIYVTHFDVLTGESCNYYIELEQVMLNENESAMATLQSLRRLALPRN